MLYALIIVAATFTNPPPPAPGLPTQPPALPTQITRADGTRVDCTPNYESCDWSQHP